MSTGTVDLVLDPTTTTSTRTRTLLPRLRDEAPLYRNDRAQLLGTDPACRRAQRFRNSTALSNKLGVSLDPISRTPEAYRTMSFLAMDDPAHLRLRTLVSKGFTRGASANSNRGSLN